MSLTDTNYVSNYQQYLSSKGSNILPGNKNESEDPTKTKTIFRKEPPVNCTLCKLLVRRDDMSKILNQGLYNKYTSSLDYYYTKDINAVILKKRKPFTIKFRDEQIFDDEREYLKKFFRKKETAMHMADIKNFYTKFKDYPKFFDAKIFGIMSSMVRKHRRLEYYKVFKGKQPEERDPPLPEEERFQFVEMLGESFKQQQQNKNELLKRQSLKNGQQTPREQKSFIEIKKSFKELTQFKDFTQTDHKFSSDYFQYHTTTQNYYQLYSRTDTPSALNEFESMMDEFSSAKKEQKFQPMLKSQVGVNKSSKKDLSVGNFTSTRTLSNTKDILEKKNAEEVRPLTSKGYVHPMPSNNAQETFNFNVPSTRNIKQNIHTCSQGSLHGNNYQVPSLNKQQSTPAASSVLKQTYRASSLDKYDSAQKDSQRGGNHQTLVSSDNFRFQPTGMVTNNSGKQSGRLSASRDSNKLGTKKLLLDTKDLQIDKQGLFRTINQRWKTTIASNQQRTPSRGKLYVPMTDFGANGVPQRENSKENTPSSNRYILTKRNFGVKHNAYEHNSAVVGEQTHHEVSSPNTNGKYKSTSQENLDKPVAGNNSKTNIEKLGVLDELDRETMRNKQSDFETLARDSKAYTSSKRLLEKVFARDSNHQQLVAALIKSPNKKARQVKVPSAQQQKDEATTSWTISENNYFNFQFPDHGKRPSPLRPKNGNTLNKNDSSSNVSSQPLLIGQASVAKIYGSKPETTKDIVSHVMRKNFSSKLVVASPSVKLQPYREQTLGRTTRRNKSTEVKGENSTQKMIDTTGTLSVHFRQKSNDNR